MVKEESLGRSSVKTADSTSDNRKKFFDATDTNSLPKASTTKWDGTNAIPAASATSNFKTDCKVDM